MNLRILIYGINFSPEQVGIGKFTGEMSQWLAKNGHTLKIICAPPYYPTWKIAQGYSCWKFQPEKFNKIDVLRCPVWVPQRTSGIKRVLHLLSFAMSSFIPMLWQTFWKPDVIIVIEPPFFATPTALMTARLSGAKAWLHIQDFEIDAAFNLGLLKSPFLHRLILGIEVWLLKRFDRISTISDRMLEKAFQKTNGQSYCVLFPNWVDTDKIYPLSRFSKFRKTWKISGDKLVLLYSGNIGEKQGLEIVLEAARDLQKDSRLIFVLCGEGAAYQRLKKSAQGIKNIIWFPLQPVEKLNELLNLADIHLLPQQANAADLVMPSKLTGMLASGKPVIATATPDTQLATVVDKMGLITPPENVEALVTAILKLAKDKTLRNKLGNSARHYAEENLGRNQVLQAFEKELIQLVTKL